MKREEGKVKELYRDKDQLSGKNDAVI
jgi:hypothetical protein